MAAIVLTVLGVGILTLFLQRGPVEMPQMQSFVQARLNAQIKEETVTIGAVAVLPGESGVANQVKMEDVELFDKAGKLLLKVPEIRTSFSLLELIKGQVAPDKISIVGSEVSVERAIDGSISFFSPDMTSDARPNILELLDSLDKQAGLAALTRVELQDTKVTFRDLASDRAWVLDNSALLLTKESGVLNGRAMIAMSDEDDGSGAQSTLLLNGAYKLGSNQSSVSFQFSDADPSEIADVFRAFDWMRNLDAKLSGSVRATLGKDGKLGDLHGVLDLSEGSLKESPERQPVKFSLAKVYFDYDPVTDILNLPEVALTTNSGSLKAEGYVGLARGDSGAVNVMSGQLRLHDIMVVRPDLFEETVTLKEAALDARISFDPLEIQVGKLIVFDGDSAFKVSGKSVAGKTHWDNNYDVDVDRIGLSRLKVLWPKIVVPKTRAWINENVSAGEISDFAGGVRSKDGEFEFAFNFGIEKADFKFIDTVPNLKEGSGFGYLTHKDIRLDLSSGYVIAPDNTRMDVAGSGLFIPDIRQKPALGEITVHAKGGVRAALGLLDSEKFRFISKAGLTPEIAQGSAVVSGAISLPLRKDVPPEDIKIALKAQVLNVKSDVLIKGKTLTAQRLDADITEKGLTMKGDGTLENVPFTGSWTQKFGKAAGEGSVVAASFGLSDANMRRFGVQLPKGAVRGTAQGNAQISIKKGTAPRYVLTSNLVGAALRVGALNWSKSSKAAGSLRMSGAFGDVPTVDDLEISAAGLTARGKLVLKAGGGLQLAQFKTLKVGRWLDTAATLRPTGGGNSAINVSGGTADLRYLGDSNGGGGSEGDATINLALDRVRITDGIALTSFSGKLNTRKGLSGKFVGRVNGSTRVDGQLFPQKFGTAIELTSKDAGGTLASSKLFHNARDGGMRMVLVPLAGKGEYDGTMEIKNVRLKDASAMASILNAISLVGLVQQMGGEGIHFSSVEGQFKLRDNGVHLKNISAVGPSMGMTLDGWYDSSRKTVNFEGVVTPLYAVNGIFERIFGPLMGRRKGEGLFSFTYRMRGAASKPKVGVNPFSILTPGAFREIFRRKVPEPKTQ